MNQVDVFYRFYQIPVYSHRFVDIGAIYIMLLHEYVM